MLNKVFKKFHPLPVASVDPPPRSPGKKRRRRGMASKSRAPENKSGSKRGLPKNQSSEVDYSLLNKLASLEAKLVETTTH